MSTSRWQSTAGGLHAFVADSGGYRRWSRGPRHTGGLSGIEGTGRRRWPGTGRPPSRASCRGSESTAVQESDTIDAEVAARSLLAGQSTAIPKTADGAVEMIRQLKITHTAMKARTTAMKTRSRSSCRPRPSCALHDLTGPAHALRRTPTGPHRHAHRQVSGRSPVGGWLSPRAARPAPAVSPPRHHRPLRGLRLGAHTAAERVGDNPDRIRSEAAFASCGACPSRPRLG